MNRKHLKKINVYKMYPYFFHNSSYDLRSEGRNMNLIINMIYELWVLVYLTANGDKAVVNDTGSRFIYLRTCVILKRK